MSHDEPSCRSSIDERMQKIHARMQLEKVSGISALQEKEQFLAFCQANESKMAMSAYDGRGEVDLPDWDGSSWRNFDKWNDAPMLASPRRKAKVS